MTKNKQSSLRYYNTDIAPFVGDHVRFEDHAEVLVVEEIVDTEDGMKDLGLTGVGLLLRGEKGASISDTLDDPELRFVSRKQ